MLPRGSGPISISPAICSPFDKPSTSPFDYFLMLFSVDSLKCGSTRNPQSSPDSIINQFSLWLGTKHVSRWDFQKPSALAFESLDRTMIPLVPFQRSKGLRSKGPHDTSWLDESSVRRLSLHRGSRNSHRAAYGRVEQCQAPVYDLVIAKGPMALFIIGKLETSKHQSMDPTATSQAVQVHCPSHMRYRQGF